MANKMLRLTIRDSYKNLNTVQQWFCGSSTWKSDQSTYNPMPSVFLHLVFNKGVVNLLSYYEHSMLYEGTPKFLLYHLIATKPLHLYILYMKIKKGETG